MGGFGSGRPRKYATKEEAYQAKIERQRIVRNKNGLGRGRPRKYATAAIAEEVHRKKALLRYHQSKNIRQGLVSCDV